MGIIQKYLQFYYLIHWLPDIESSVLTEKDIIDGIFCNSNPKRSKSNNAIAQRTVILGALFMYLSLKFYYEEPLSYFFSLIFNANNIATANKMSDAEFYHYQSFIDTHLAITKLFCAAHEVAHIPKEHDTPRDISWHKTALEYLLTSKQLPLSNVYPQYTPNEDILQRLRNLNQDKLQDELIADIEGLSYLRTMYKSNMFHCSFKEYASMVLFSIDTFYDFQALICGITEGWNRNLGYIKSTTKSSEFCCEPLGTDHAVRSLLLPILLAKQFDDESYLSSILFLQEYDAARGNNNRVNIKQELANLSSMAFNYSLVEIIRLSYKNGFTNAGLKIKKARDILLGIIKEENLENITSKDIFIQGGKCYGTDFYVFANGYGFY